MKKLRYLTIILLAIVAYSCRTPKENVYFGDATDLQVFEVVEQEFVKIKPGNKISVVISTGISDFDDLFNATYNSRYFGRNANYTYPQREYVSLYTVDPDGEICLPVIGYLKVEGLTRAEVARLVERELIEKGYVQNAVAVVEFERLTITLLGEVASPGRYVLDRDGVTVIDAITKAGDINVNGNRNNVKIIRTENGKKRTYVVDMNSAQSVMGSPGYYLQQDDIIYVEPNEKRVRQSVAGANDLYTTSFWLRISSLLTSAAALFIK